MSGFRYRRTRRVGKRGGYVTITNRGVRAGVRRGRVTASQGTNGQPYLSAKIARGLWYVFKSGR